jgi:hypothetical protein
MEKTDYSVKCFSFLAPLLKEELIDAREAYILGYTLKAIDLKHFESIMNVIERVLILKRSYQTGASTLDMIYSLLLEGDWSAVIFV